MSFLKQNEKFETWLRSQCSVVEVDLVRKHRRMRHDAMSFLRATYFYWAQHIEAICPEVKGAPGVLAVGDMHIENFGTWRDAEGRLIWGVNDFDEAATMPYAFDLVRLATSVKLYPGRRALSTSRACEAILTGYGNGLHAPRPTLLDEQATWMRPLVACSDSDRLRFWREIDDLNPCEPPQDALKALHASLPSKATVDFYASRTKGGGSLGRPRFIVVAHYQGGRIVREAKAFVTSTWSWAHDEAGDPSSFMRLAMGRYRAPDPHLAVHDKAFILRRVAADSRKIEFGTEGNTMIDERILAAMGADLAAIHCADEGSADAVIKDFDARPKDWLHASVTRAANWAEGVYKSYVEHMSVAGVPLN
jgi:Uncharacterized protein conserved in bacteria (DUF2252)